ncbi:MAG: hypothetical protein K0S27_1606 [Gammaproteobacteria bacterium]|jgi:glycosyltransferase involved in cell wall biosynthesis|nr:hypothetical protein [Gammaproteobacteria bacterium]
MRIGIGSTKLEPILGHGPIDGIGIYVQYLLQHYNMLNYDILPVSYPALSCPWRKTALPNSTHFSTPYSLATAAALTPFGPLLNYSLEKKIDLFHAPDYLIPRFKKIPVLATLHDAIMLKHPAWCNPNFRKLKNFLIKNSLQWADHFIAISKAMVPDLIEFWGVDEKKISVIYQGISDWWLEKVPDEEKNHVLEKLNIKKNFCLSVGTLQPRKNFTRIIQAYEQLPAAMQKEHKLVLVGKDGWQSTQIRHDIMRATTENKAIWLQYVSQKELRILYQSAQLLLFPSLSEGFGSPILEAFASNIPIITSNLTSLPEIAGNAAYFVNPYSIEEITQGMITLLTNPSLCATLIKRGRERVQEFTLKKCAEETFKVYQKLLRHGG